MQKNDNSIKKHKFTIGDENETAIKYFKYDVDTHQSEKYLGHERIANNILYNLSVANGLQHFQESGFISPRPFTAKESLYFAMQISANLPHASEIIDSFQVTDIKELHSLVQDGKYVGLSKDNQDNPNNQDNQNKESKHFYTITYDFDYNKLKEIKKYSSPEYNRLNSYLIKNGFEKTQNSTLVSKDLITLSETESIIKNFFDKNPDYEKFTNRMNISIMGKNFDILPFVDDLYASQQKGHEKIMYNLLDLILIV